MNKYRVLIGLEMHCEISETNTKVFSPAKNDYSEIPNINVCAIDMAFPGILPLVNKEAVKKAIMASMILNCKQPEYLYFERKNYYYPDLPKGYQITQETKPIPIGIYGSFTYEVNDDKKTVRINNIHLEEDAASIDHYESYSTIDYNRAGVPLLELVTEPDFRSAEEAVAFLETMRSVYQYAGISEADSKKGQVRCDVNVSIMDEDKDETDMKNWGTKIEIKNVNSFGGVRDAINYEIKRQTEAKEDGTYDEMPQQTRRWDEETGTTIFMRSKVDAIDYKYFVEPNIPKYKISSEWLEQIKKEIPELSFERKERYIKEFELSEYDASIIVKEKEISDFFESTVKEGANPKISINWINGIILSYLNKNEFTINDIILTPNMLKELISLVYEGKISIKQGKEVLVKALDEKKDPNKLVKELNIEQLDNDDEIKEIIQEVINENNEAIEKYKNGKTNAIDYLVGQVMMKTKGKANPLKTMNMMKEMIK